MAKIYVLRRDLLPENYDYNTVLAMTEEQFAHEMNRQLDLCLQKYGKEDNFIAIYDFMDFEELINCEEHGVWDPGKYYIRFFDL